MLVSACLKEEGGKPELVAVIRPRSPVRILTFVAVLFALLGYLGVITHLPASAPAPPLLFSLFAVTGGLTALTGLGGQLLGQEVLTVTWASLHVRHEIGAWECSREFEIGRIGSIRQTPLAHGGWRRSRHDPILRFRPGGLREGEIEFDYDLQDYRFGMTLTSEETEQLLREIAKVLPSKTVLATRM